MGPVTSGCVVGWGARFQAVEAAFGGELWPRDRPELASRMEDLLTEHAVHRVDLQVTICVQ